MSTQKKNIIDSPLAIFTGQGKCSLLLIIQNCMCVIYACVFMCVYLRGKKSTLLCFTLYLSTLFFIIVCLPTSETQQFSQIYYMISYISPGDLNFHISISEHQNYRLVQLFLAFYMHVRNSESHALKQKLLQLIYLPAPNFISICIFLKIFGDIIQIAFISTEV